MTWLSQSLKALLLVPSDTRCTPQKERGRVAEKKDFGLLAVGRANRQQPKPLL